MAILTRLFVRVGALRRFDLLKKKTAELPVKVEWDRRRQDRRSPAAANAAADQRKGDRRGAPPFTWDTADFVVVEESLPDRDPD